MDVPRSRINADLGSAHLPSPMQRRLPGGPAADGGVARQVNAHHLAGELCSKLNLRSSSSSSSRLSRQGRHQQREEGG